MKFGEQTCGAFIMLMQQTYVYVGNVIEHKFDRSDFSKRKKKSLKGI